MKRLNKKLALSRETLRRLDERALQAAAGGNETYSCATCGTDSDFYCSHTDCSVVCLVNNGCTGAC